MTHHRLLALPLVLVPLLAAGSLAAADGRASPGSEAQTIVEDAVAVVQTMKSDRQLAKLLEQSQGVLIVPHLVPGASASGGTGGEGVLLANKDGAWSSPAFFSIGSISIPGRAAGARGAAAMIFMTEEALLNLAGNTKISLGPAAGLDVIGYRARAANLGSGDVVVWSEHAEAFTAATLSVPEIRVNEAKNRAYYGRSALPLDIIRGTVENPHDKKLQQALPG